MPESGFAGKIPDIARAQAFVTTHGRVLDRRRLDHLLNGDRPEGILSALDAYRNADGGFGWGLESDLRSPGSQPAAALHAFEAFAEAAPLISPHAVRLCDWLASVTLDDGGLPFSLPIDDPAGCAPWWLDADRSSGSLQITAVCAANAHEVARHDPAVAAHPWLERATGFCMDQIARLEGEPHAYVLLFSIWFLDAIADSSARAAELLGDLGRFIPDSGIVHVEGGTPNEVKRPLDFAPAPDRPARRLFAPDAVAADLERLAAEQRPDGGWHYEPVTFSPASALEWRAYATIDALAILKRNGVLA